MSKRKVSVEDKIYAVNLYLDGKESQRRIAHMFDVSLASVQQWIRNYESMGANAFTLKGNKKYSKNLVYTTMLHEIGHALGLQESTRKQSSIMNMPISETQDILKKDIVNLYHINGWSYMDRRFNN